MGFQIAMAPISDEEMKKIRDSKPTGGYNGPTPPPGVYKAKIARVWFSETKAGHPAVKVSFVLHDEGANSVYNGASVLQNYNIPTDPSQKAFPVQVSQLDAFLIALSGGKMGYKEFQEACTSGKTDADPGKRDEIGLPVTQVGKVKITGERVVEIKTKIREWNGKEYIDVHYILDNPTDKEEAAVSTDDIDLGNGEDSSDDDLDSWLES